MRSVGCGGELARMKEFAKQLRQDYLGLDVFARWVLTLLIASAVVGTLGVAWVLGLGLYTLFDASAVAAIVGIVLVFMQTLAPVLQTTSIKERDRSIISQWMVVLTCLTVMLGFLGFAYVSWKVKGKHLREAREAQLDEINKELKAPKENYEGARRMLEESESIIGDHWRYHDLMAISYKLEADSLLREARDAEKVPSLAQEKRNHARDRLEAAAKEADRAVSLAPANRRCTALANHGIYLVRMGKLLLAENAAEASLAFDAGARKLRESRQTDDDFRPDPTAVQTEAQAYVQLGQMKEAARLYIYSLSGKELFTRRGEPGSEDQNVAPHWKVLEDDAIEFLTVTLPQKDPQVSRELLQTAFPALQRLTPSPSLER